MIRFILLSIIVLFNLSAQTTVQTDTHTYIVSKYENKVLVIDRKTGEEKIIEVDRGPLHMVIHGYFGYVVNFFNVVTVINLQTNMVTTKIPVGDYPVEMFVSEDMGYVVNSGSATVSVIDLQTQKVINTVYVGKNPQYMSFYKSLGYVVNRGSNSVSVIDLKTNTFKETITVGQEPRSMLIHEDIGYVLNHAPSTVSVIDLKTQKVINTISVGEQPIGIVIYGNFGYVINYGPSTVSVIDLQTHTVKNTIPVGKDPRLMVIHGDFGYVVNHESRTVSVIDLQAHTIKNTIAVGYNPDSMVIHEDWGYVTDIDDADFESNKYSKYNVSVIDLKTRKVLKKFKIPYILPIDISDTHVYLGIKKVLPHYPTLASLARMKAQDSLADFVKMNPKLFNIGEVKERYYPKDKNVFDRMPLYVLTHHLFWDVNTDKPLMDPVDILATLATMQSPQKLLQNKPVGPWLRSRLHMAFFQAVWVNDGVKAEKMLRYFIQLKDPVISKLATYKLVKLSATLSGVTNSTSK